MADSEHGRRFDLQLKGEPEQPIAAESLQLCQFLPALLCDRRQSSHSITKQPQYAIKEGTTNSALAAHL
jgi:hypothetical protein